MKWVKSLCLLAVLVPLMAHAGWNVGGSGGSGGSGGGALDTSTADVTLSNSATPTVLYTYSLPANALTTKQCMMQEVLGQITGNNSITLTITATYGPQSFVRTFTPAAITTEPISIRFELCGDGAANAQLGYLDTQVGATSSRQLARGVLTVDSTAIQTMSLTATWGSASSAVTIIKQFERVTSMRGVLQTDLDTHVAGTSVHGATAANTANRIVTRDASGNFAAGTITAALAGNATTATTATSATTAATAAALGADPTDCGANSFATGIAANGNLTCAQPNYSNLLGSLPLPAVGTRGGAEALTCSGTDRFSALGTDGKFVCSATASGGGGGGGPITIEGLTGTVFDLTTGTTGTDVNWAATAPGTIALNIPDASSTTRGLVSPDPQVISGPKTYTDSQAAPGYNVTGVGAGILDLVAPDTTHTWGLQGTLRSTDLWLTVDTDPITNTNPMAVCTTPVSGVSSCTFPTRQTIIDTLMNTAAATNEYVWTKDTVSGNGMWKAAAGGGGGVTGPGSSTANALVRWNGTAGTALKNTSQITIDDSGNMIMSVLNTNQTVCTNGTKTLVTCAGNQQQVLGDVAVAITPGIRQALLQSTLTAQRTYTLPAATNYPHGSTIQFIDESGTLTATNNMRIVRGGSDTINGSTTLPQFISIPYGMMTFVSDGSSKWFVDQGPTNASALSTGTIPTARMTDLQTVGDGSVTLTIGKRQAVLTAALTAPRTWTLPAASNYAPGFVLTLADQIGGISTTNPLTITKNAADTGINGATNYVMTQPFSTIDLITDGGTPGNWTVDTRYQNASALSSGTIPGAQLINAQSVGNANATITGGKRQVYLTAALTAARTLTLPSAASYPPGGKFEFIDTTGSLTSTNKMNFQIAGTDIINGSLSTISISAPYSIIDFVSDGGSPSGKWTVDTGGGWQTESAGVLQCGDDAGTPSNCTLKSADATTNDTSAAQLILSTGTGRGSGPSGAIRFQTSTSTASGATVQATVDRMIILPGKSLTDTAIPLFDIALSAGQTTGGIYQYTIFATDGASVQALTGICTYAAVNKAGVYSSTVTCDTGNDAKAISAAGGTLTASFALVAGTNKVTFTLTPAGSLTETTYGLSHILFNQSGRAITIL